MSASHIDGVPKSATLPELPSFDIIGADDHPLGKRSVWLYADGHGEMLTESYGIKSVVKFRKGKGHAALAEMAEAFRAYDAGEDPPGFVPLFS